MYTKREFVGVGVLTAITLGLVFLFGFAAVPAFAQTSDDYGVANSGNYCPKLSITMQRGARDVSYSGQVSELQKFISDYYDIDPDEIVTGFFGRITQGYVQQFQREQGLPTFGIAGSMTRAAIAKVCTSNTFSGSGQTVPNTTNTTPTTPSTSYVPVPTTSTLTPDQIKVNYPANTTISVGGKVTIIYTVGSNIVAGNPAIIERSIVNANTDAMNSGYVPVTQSAGTYTFDWIPNEPGTYQAVLKINLNNTQYTARSGVITVVGTPISSTNLLTPVVSVNTSPASVTAGQSSLLYWNSTNANRCVLKYGSSEENISVSGSKTVTPSQTTTYLVWCANDPGNGKDGPATSGSATISVSAASAPSIPTVSFQSSPSTIGTVQYSSLSWSTSNANRCVLQYGSSEENVAVNGSKTVSPSQTTSYRLWCVNDPGTGKDGPSAEKTIAVSVASPSCTLTTNKNSYQYGETIVFSWTGQNATYASFWQDNSGKDHLWLPGDKLNASGSQSVTANVTGNPSATLLIYNYYGNSSCSVTIPVN